MKATPIEIVQAFLMHLNSGRIDQGMDMLAQDVFYHNVPLEPMYGREAVRAFAREFGMGSRLRVDWRTVSIAANGATVLTERVDEFIAADGRKISIPLMGSFVVRNGAIAEWRDYFDLRELERQMATLGM